ncbi:hypothetical protein [Paenisporosarcina sp. TG20]|uniref:hypothetical protein n=1 Tax=Paenisporosarcina sp. TG20 TaxID=1211706 RepID=UPI0002E54933|nr:hypothetical protein [Paenisporosarcina sp. TG20]
MPIKQKIDKDFSKKRLVQSVPLIESMSHSTSKEIEHCTIHRKQITNSKSYEAK